MGGFRYPCSRCLKTVHVYCTGIPFLSPRESPENCEEHKEVQEDANSQEKGKGGNEGTPSSNSPTATLLPHAPTEIAVSEPIADTVTGSHAGSLDFQSNISATSPPDAVSLPALSCASATGMLTHHTVASTGTTTRSVSSITDSFVYLKSLLSGVGGADRAPLPAIPESGILRFEQTRDTCTRALLSEEPSKTLESGKSGATGKQSVEQNTVPWVSCVPLDSRAVDELPQVENLEATIRFLQDMEKFLTSSAETTWSLTKAQGREPSEMLFCNNCLIVLEQKAEDTTKNLEAELQLYTQHWETLPGVPLQRYHLHQSSAQEKNIHENASRSSHVSQEGLSASTNPEWKTDEGSESEASAPSDRSEGKRSSSLTSEPFLENDVSVISGMNKSHGDATNTQHAEKNVSAPSVTNINQTTPKRAFDAEETTLTLKPEISEPYEAPVRTTNIFKAPDGCSDVDVCKHSVSEVSGLGTLEMPLRDERKVQYLERPDRGPNATFSSEIQKNTVGAAFKDVKRESSLQMSIDPMEQGASWPTRESTVTASDAPSVSPFLVNNLILNEELQMLVKRRDALEKKRAKVKKSCAKYERLYAELQTLCFEQSTRFSALEARARFSAHHASLLAKSNAINDAFHIGVQKIYGTINYIRLGKIPTDDVTWDEVNAAWGQTALLLDCLIQLTLDIYHVCSVGSSPRFRELDTSGKLPQLDHLLSYRILPRGSQSAVLRRSDSSMYELYGTGGGISKFFATRRFDSAMVVVLGVTKDLINLAAFLGDFLSFSRETLRPPFRVTAETIGGVSIRLPGASGGEEWCRCLKYLLLNLKWLLGIGEGLLALSTPFARQRYRATDLHEKA